MESDLFAQELVCAICLELFTDPVTLRCGHTFCRLCVTRCWGDRRSSSCPVCRRVVPARDLRGSRALRNLAERARYSDRRAGGCEGSERPCAVCAADPGQRALGQGPRSQQQEDSPASAIYSLRKARATSLECIQEQEQNISKIKEQTQSLHIHIRSEFAELYQLLAEREQRLLRALRQDKERLLDDMERNLHTLYKDLESIDRQLLEMEQQASGPFLPPEVQWPGIPLLQPRSPLSGELGTTEQVSEPLTGTLCVARHGLTHPEHSPSPLRPERRGSQPVLAPQLSLGVFRGPLQFAAWKGMLDQLSPAPSTLTLDPDSAHRRLLLSEDLRAVSHGDGSLPPAVPGPRRFHPYVCVLAAQGLASGRHYWEVEVGSKPKWDVGLVRESVDRAGREPPSPSAGYWIVWLRNGHEYWALTEPRTRLSPRRVPRTVGVYLDYEGGQVSFYDADGMVHLHTFTDTFTETLYPYFSPGLNDGGRNSEPLRIRWL
ncbi:nuclear factor 7, brain-like [Hypanus sabinus]|uniref:nuclear factor 7, brain-like n=1 Tax=Hypanus sabinus TaxID=79690 RepID=UPI0028C3EFC3|nr:nuclear factor 7, brain-like [Hypanus sabinus]